VRLPSGLTWCVVSHSSPWCVVSHSSPWCVVSHSSPWCVVSHSSPWCLVSHSSPVIVDDEVAHSTPVRPGFHPEDGRCELSVIQEVDTPTHLTVDSPTQLGLETPVSQESGNSIDSQVRPLSG